MSLAAVSLAGVSLLGVACSAGGSKGDDATVGAQPGTGPVSPGSGGSLNGGGGSLLPDDGPNFGSEVAPPKGTFSGIPECEACNDFPLQPIFEDGLGPEVAGAFNQASSGTPPCIVEPSDGMLIPANMLRPRVRFSAPGSVAGQTACGQDAAGQNGGQAAGAPRSVYQITLHTPREVNDLVVYTTQNPWLIPPDIWAGLSKNVFEEDITITLKTSVGNAAPSESSARFRIAPVQAGGTMVYWAATSELSGLETTRLMAFGVGEEAVVTALRPGDVEETMLGDNGNIKRAEFGAPQGQARCVGCHTSTGDGKAVITGDHWPWNLAVSDLTGGQGGRPADVTPFGALLMQMPWLGVSTTSRGDWALGKRVLITSAGPRNAMNAGFTPNPNTPQQDMAFGQIQNQTGRDGLIWINMAAEGTVPVLDGMNDDKEVGQAMLDARATGGWGVIARTGDGRAAVMPDWSHDGKTIAYTSTDSTSDGRVGQATDNEADIYTVPYADGQGGQATPLPGASTAGIGEYYPDFSADDRFVAFTRVQDRQGRRYYYHDRGEIYVVPAAGGTPTRLAANDPPACSNEPSPGVINSWPKWSPTVRSGPDGTPHAGKKYYFVLFSSARQSPCRLGQGPASQLYMATVVEELDGTLKTFPAMYLWNQSFEIVDPAANPPQVAPVQTSNLTPAFDEFVIPARPPVIVR